MIVIHPLSFLIGKINSEVLNSNRKVFDSQSCLGDNINVQLLYILQSNYVSKLRNAYNYIRSIVLLYSRF